MPTRLGRRLNTKTPSAVALRRLPLEAAPVLEEEKASERKTVYLVTVPHPKQSHSSGGLLLRAPDSLSHADVLAALCDAFANPLYGDVGNTALHGGAQTTLNLLKAVVFLEAHKADESGVAHMHFHIALAGDRPFYFSPLKRALLVRSHLATHWSTSHSGYWSTVRYGHIATPRKPAASLDPLPLLWSAVGQHPPLDEVCEEPSTAAAVKRRRLLKEQAASEQGKEAPRPVELDVWPLVIRHNIRNTPDASEAHLELLKVARTSCSPAMVQFLFKIRRQLPALIDDVWMLEEIDDRVELSKQTRMDALLAAASKPCVCDSQWPVFVQAALLANGIDPCCLAHDIYGSFRHGRCETVPTIVLAGLQGGEGKSLIWMALAAVLGEDYVQEGLATGSFPFLGLD